MRTLVALAAAAALLTGCSSSSPEPAQPVTPAACTRALGLAEQGLEAIADALDSAAAGDFTQAQVDGARARALREQYGPQAAACRSHA